MPRSFRSPADLQIIGNNLHVTTMRSPPPAAPRALTGLCDDLTATRTTYPGANLILVYAVKDR